jgi:hypothetical protein
MWGSKFRTYTISFQNYAGSSHTYHENVNVHKIGQGKAQCGKYKRLKLSGAQAHDRSTV